VFLGTVGAIDWREDRIVAYVSLEWTNWLQINILPVDDDDKQFVTV